MTILLIVPPPPSPRILRRLPLEVSGPVHAVDGGDAEREQREGN